MITKNIPLLLNLAYCAYNRGLSGGDFAPRVIQSLDGAEELITHCNEAMNYILSGLGYDAMRYHEANDMYDFMNDSRNGWISIDPLVAQQHANSGVIVLACWKNPSGHGHVCLVLPGIVEKSNSFGYAVPKVCNIGKDVFFGKKLSFAFRASEAPTLFALKEQI